MSNLVFRPEPLPQTARLETAYGEVVTVRIGQSFPHVAAGCAGRVDVTVSTDGNSQPLREAETKQLTPSAHVPRFPVAPMITLHAGPFTELTDARCVGGFLAPIVKAHLEAMAAELEALRPEWEKLCPTP